MSDRAMHGVRRRPAQAVLVVVVMAASMLGPGAGPAAAQTPSQAVVAARANAGNNGVTSFISVVDRNTGAVLGQTSNAGAQVASESIMKLFLATYYLWSYGGYSKTPQSVRDRLSFMLRYSDDDTASALFTASAIPTVAANYGLGSTGNATDRVGHWGAARITASDMTRFLFRASKDPKVGPWLIPVMSQTARTGSGADAGFSQHFGLNALSGVHGSKQGWGCDSYWTAPQCAVHSVGYTDRYFVAVLQLGGYPDPMRSTATASARLIQQSTLPLVDGDFICDSVGGAVFRMAGGAPVYVSSWSAMGGPKPCRSMSRSAIDQLPDRPREGTFVRASRNGAVYRVIGGAPVYVSSWAAFGGEKPTVTVDSAAVDRAGSGGHFDHLRAYPADGTFIQASRGSAVYRMAGGAPIYVSSWARFGGKRPTITVDPAAIANAGAAGRWKHLRAYPLDGTFVRGTDGAVYRIAGGAPIRVTTWVPFGGTQRTTIIDLTALSRAGSGGVWNHLRMRPAEGTFVRSSDGAVYRIAGGAPIFVTTWSAVGGPKPYVVIDSAAVANAGTGGGWDHLRQYPVDGTFLRGATTGAVFRVAGGAPLYVPSWSPFGGQQPLVDIDHAATSRAGRGGAYNHLRMTPADGTFLRGQPGTRTYRVQGGVAVFVPSWDPFGGPQPVVRVNQLTIDRAGSGGDYNHLLGAR